MTMYFRLITVLLLYFFTDPKSVVECSFVTEFDDHIFVAMDAEAILFLHDLVTHYVKEKDRGLYALTTYCYIFLSDTYSYSTQRNAIIFLFVCML